MLEITFIPAFKDNYIWLLHNDGHAAVVDPGDASAVIWRLKAEGFDLQAILVTHHHPDHQGGVQGLLAEYDVPVYGPEIESITGCNRPLSGGEGIEVLGQRFDVLSVPGHTRGHLAYLTPGAVFCGDTLFGGGCGRIFEGTPADMLASLKQLAALPDETLVYCAHEYTEANLRFAMEVEPKNSVIANRAAVSAFQRLRGKPTIPSTIGEEKRTNPFLRCDDPSVIATALKRGVTNDDLLSVFTAIREWKNTY